MTRTEIAKKIAVIAEEIRPSHLMASAMLYAVAGSVAGGEKYEQSLSDLICAYCKDVMGPSLLIDCKEKENISNTPL